MWQRLLIALALLVVFLPLVACLLWVACHPAERRIWWRVRQQRKAEMRTVKIDREWNPRPHQYRHLWPDQIPARSRLANLHQRRVLRQSRPH
jgi:hypothetical protein